MRLLLSWRLDKSLLLRWLFLLLERPSLLLLVPLEVASILLSLLMAILFVLIDEVIDCIGLLLMEHWVPESKGLPGLVVVRLVFLHVTHSLVLIATIGLLLLLLIIEASVLVEDWVIELHLKYV